MKRTVDLLTANEKEALAHLYELPGYKALIKLCQLEINAIAKDALLSPDHETTRYLHGQAFAYENLPRLVRNLYKDLKD
jgi:homoaconitase/3-isopropylmalate dehydratase large subunit